MGPVSAIVLYVVVWSMVFFIALPIRVKTQGDLSDIVPGTHAGAPEHHHLKKKALWTTLVALILWGGITTVILSEWITVDEIEGFFNRLLGPSDGRDG